MYQILIHVHAFVGKDLPEKEPSREGQLRDAVGLDEPCEEVPEKARTFFKTISVHMQYYVFKALCND